jgi:hypothetical protein
LTPGAVSHKLTFQYQSGLGEWFGDLAPMQSHQFSS